MTRSTDQPISPGTHTPLRVERRKNKVNRLLRFFLIQPVVQKVLESWLLRLVLVLLAPGQKGVFQSVLEPANCRHEKRLGRLRMHEKGSAFGLHRLGMRA